MNGEPNDAATGKIIGADVGGTFTDVVMWDGVQIATAKVPTSWLLLPRFLLPKRSSPRTDVEEAAGDLKATPLDDGTRPSSDSGDAVTAVLQHRPLLAPMTTRPLNE